MTDRSAFAAKAKLYMGKDLYASGMGEVLTIRDVREVTFTNGAKTEHKLVIDWKEDRPGLALNTTNLAFMISTFGGDDDAWVRRQVYVFHDPTVKAFPGRPPGGIVLDTPPKVAAGPVPSPRAEALKQQIAGAQGVAVAAKPEIDDDIPF